MGNDLTENYYQIEVPLQVSKTETPEIWPTVNEINLPIDILGRVKALGISAMSLNNEDATFYDVIDGVLNEEPLVDSNGLSDGFKNYPTDPSGTDYKKLHRIGIKGNPNFGDIRTLMV